MKIVKFILITIIFSSCYSGDDNGKEGDFGVNVLIINGCQYATYITGRGVSMVHAGNCNNHGGGKMVYIDTVGGGFWKEIPNKK